MSNVEKRSNDEEYDSDSEKEDGKPKLSQFQLAFLKLRGRLEDCKVTKRTSRNLSPLFGEPKQDETVATSNASKANELSKSSEDFSSKAKQLSKCSEDFSPKAKELSKSSEDFLWKIDVVNSEEEQEIERSQDSPVHDAIPPSYNVDVVDSEDKQEPERLTGTPEQDAIQSNINFEDIILRIEILENTVKTFRGTRDSKQFRHLETSLLKCLVDLDDIKTDHKESVVGKRKEMTSVINRTLSELYCKADCVIGY